MINGKRVNIYWLDLNRFDVKTNKSPWLEMSEVLNEEGFNVTILCSYLRERYSPANYHISMKYLPATHLPGLFRYSLLLSMTIWLLVRVRAHDIVIVQPSSLIGGMVVKVLRRCHLHMDVRTVPVEVQSAKGRINRYLFWEIPLWLFGKRADSYSFITKMLKASVEREFKVKFEDHVIWSSGVRTDQFRDACRAEDDKVKDVFTLFYHGTVTRNRGLGLVVRGIAKLRAEIREQLLFVIVGQGNGIDEIKQLAAALGVYDNIVIKQRMPYEQIPGMIKSADCCICPLPDRPEWNMSSPLKIFEYLACSKPVIVTPIIAHRAILAIDCPYVVWTRDDTPESFQCAIHSAFMHKDALAKSAKEAPDFVKKKHDWSIRGRSFADYLKKRMERRTGAVNQA